MEAAVPIVRRRSKGGQLLPNIDMKELVGICNSSIRVAAALERASFHPLESGPAPHTERWDADVHGYPQVPWQEAPCLNMSTLTQTG